MPMRYADEQAVIAHLKIKEGDTSAIERAVEVENGLAATFDRMVGYKFGAAPEPQTRWVTGDGTDLLYLGYPGARSIVSVAVDGRWDGAGWVDEVVLAPTAWWPWIANDRGTTTLRLTEGDWTGTVRVTAVWADQPAGETVPADVREAITMATVKEYRRLTSSPREQVGPDGQMIPTPSGLTDPQFRAAVRHHAIRRQRAGV